MVPSVEENLPFSSQKLWADRPWRQANLGFKISQIWAEILVSLLAEILQFLSGHLKSKTLFPYLYFFLIFFFFTPFSSLKEMAYPQSVQFSSVAQLCPTLFDPMNRSTSGLPVHHQLPKFTQTHVHRVSDAIQPSHPLLSPSPPAPNPSQHQSLFQ